MTIQETVENEMIEIINRTMCTIFESVCNSQSRKSFRVGCCLRTSKERTEVIN